MSAILKFLTAARSLANQGLSKEAIEQFARNEFGEISELFQKQINNIFKPGKGITSIKKKAALFGKWQVIAGVEITCIDRVTVDCFSLVTKEI